MAEIIDNHDGEYHCHFCGARPQMLANLDGNRIICQHCLADASARLAFESGLHVCGECRAFVLAEGPAEVAEVVRSEDVCALKIALAMRSAVAP